MALEVRIQKKLGDFQLNVAFQAEGETLALLGASGSGKSMTLKCIAGIEAPDEGCITLDGRVLFDSSKGINLPPQQRQVGYLFQQYALFPNMTVRENIACAVRDRKARPETVQRHMEAMRLTGQSHLYPSQLSGGQQQRVALARILANEPEVLLLDEPFSALDSYLRWQLELELADTLKQYGRHTLFVSHSRDEVYRLCDRVCVLSDGHSEPVVPTGDLFACPRTTAAALLSGCKNFSQAIPTGPREVFAKDWNVTLAVSHAPQAADCIGVRAHSFDLARDGDSQENVLECQVIHLIQDVFSAIVMLRPQGAADTPHGQIRWETDKETVALLEVGQQVHLAIKPKSIMLLAKEERHA